MLEIPQVAMLLV